MSGSTSSPSNPSSTSSSRPLSPPLPPKHSTASESSPMFFLSPSFEVYSGERSLPRNFAVNAPPPPPSPIGRIVEVRCYDERRQRGIPTTVPVEIIEEKIRLLRLALGLPAHPEGRPLLESEPSEPNPFAELDLTGGWDLSLDDVSDCSSSDTDLDLDF